MKRYCDISNNFLPQTSASSPRNAIQDYVFICFVGLRAYFGWALKPIDKTYQIIV